MSKSNRRTALSRKIAAWTPRERALVLTSALALVGIPVLAPLAQATWQDSPKATLDQAWQIVDHDYVDPNFNNVDWQQVRQELLSQDYTSRDAAYTALRDALKQLDDPYTRFMDPQEFQAFTNQTNGELVGVGIRLTVSPDTQVLTVVQPIPDSPAIEAGIQPDDQILQVDGTPTQDLSVEEAAAMIRGKAGTTVDLLIHRNDTAPFVVTLTRQPINVPVVTSAVRQEDGHEVGYIRLSEFNAHSAEEMQTAIKDLSAQSVDGFVLDLRNNPGGRLDQAIAIARMWLEKGDIVRTVDRDGNTEQAKANHTALTSLPLVVLVNGNSASASEILTGALKDDHRATVIGTQTFGKALVQSVNPLNDGSGLNVTIAHYYTPSGADINHRGISPDVEVTASEDAQKELWLHPDRLGTNQDQQYVQAVTQLNNQIARQTPAADEAS